MVYNLFIGRFQPLHDGHEKLFRTILDEGKAVCVALRDTEIDEKNPLTIEERELLFKTRFAKEMEEGQMKVIVVPDIEAVCYGRGVGYDIREIRLDEQTEKISATKIREGKT